MSRGRHRQASKLRRALPSLACAVLALAALSAALLSSSLGVLRVLVVSASVGACAAAVLLRTREEAAEQELVSERASRVRDEARAEERIAELEYQAEAAEEQVKRLERRVLAQRSQLAHAEASNGQLLRERARIAAEQALREAEAVQALEASKRGTRPTPAAYLKAVAALRTLERRAEQAESSSSTLSLRQPALPPAPATVTPPQPASAQAPDGRQSGFFERATVVRPGDSAPAPGGPAAPAADAAQPAEQQPQAPVETASALPARKAGFFGSTAASSQGGVRAPEERQQRLVAPYVAGHQNVAAGITPSAATAPAWARAALPPMRPAAAVPPTAVPRQGRATGTFNFFSRQESAIGSKLVSGDPADVIGDEAAAAQARYVAAPEAPSVLPTNAHERTEHAIVDLTAEDETEPIDVRAIRAV